MSKYEKLFKYIEPLSEKDIGELVASYTRNGIVHLPFYRYSKDVMDFIVEVHNVAKEANEMNYAEILEENNINWSSSSMSGVDIKELSSKVLFALILAAVRADRFCEGALFGFLREGTIQKWLRQLKKNEE